MVSSIRNSRSSALPFSIEPIIKTQTIAFPFTLTSVFGNLVAGNSSLEHLGILENLDTIQTLAFKMESINAVSSVRNSLYK